MDKIRQCKYCHTSFKPAKHNHIFCAKACANESVKLKRQGLAVGKDSFRECVWCGSKHKFTNRKFCSKSCSYKSQSNDRNSARRARIFSVPRLKFNRQELILRDGVNCRHCGIKTTDADVLDASHINIDHIIPISKGGHHTIYNSQVLCRSCNNAKGSQLYDIDVERSKDLWPIDPIDFIRSAKELRIRKDNKSGVKGVFFNKGIGKWIARIDMGKKRVTLIQINNKEQAIEYRALAEKLIKDGIKFEDVKAECRGILDAKY